MAALQRATPSSRPRRLLIAAAVTGSLVAGAGFGVTVAPWLVTRAADATAGAAGWTLLPPAIPGNAIRAAIARAVRALQSPAAFPPATIATLVRTDDDEGRPLDGASRYVLHFAAGGPSDAPWSLAALDRDGSLLDDARPLLAGGADMRRNGDGSLDVLVQAASPDDAAANWLAAPPGPFSLVLRFYTPGAARLVRPTLVRRESAA